LATCECSFFSSLVICFVRVKCWHILCRHLALQEWC
jgi:hypothetical protein